MPDLSTRAPAFIRRRTWLFVAALAATACGGSIGGANDAAQEIATAGGRLRGTWTVMGFHPAVPLEPMLAQLLAAQIGYLTVKFDTGRISASGIGVRADRTYRINDATMNDFTATLYDEAGVAYDIRARFDGNLLRFESLTVPWTGDGTLERSGP